MANHDIIVFDSTPAGLFSAIAAAGAGANVLIVTDDPHVGGMQTSGLGWTNTGQRPTIGGLVRQFHQRILAYYTKEYGAGSQQVEVCTNGFRFEPHVAERIYDEWLQEAGVSVLRETVVTGVKTRDRRITALTTGDGRRLAGDIFVDASYEGDLLAWAGCSYRVGREGRDEYDESLAGVRFPPEEEGQPDGKTQGYDWRLCLTQVKENQIPFRKPPSYNPALYAYTRAQLRHAPPSELKRLISLNPMPNGKTDSRTGEWTGGSWDYPEASRPVRQYIVRKHREYSEGYLWFLLSDEAVPGALRDELATYGYAADEFVDNGHWPYHLYVREARRLVGDWVMSQRDVAAEAHRVKEDGVAIGSFFLDVHAVRYVADADAPGGLRAAGGLGRQRVKPYEIPYRALLPQRAELTNLLVPLCLSASHIAYSTIRMEPVYGMLGHAAGLAAAQSLTSGQSLHSLDADRLRQDLADQEQVLDASPFHDTW